MGLITSSSSIGGYGTISCFDGGLKVMVCDVGFYLTNGGLVKGVNATVTTFTAGGVQAGTESIDQWFDIGPLYKKYEDQIEEPLYVAGEYNARVTGAIAYMGKTGEGILNILPIKSAEVTIE